MAKENRFPANKMDDARYAKLLDMNSAYLGVSRLVLMENAGREVAAVCSRFSDISVFCGAGNNGGDGFAAARHLSSMGKKVTVYAVAGVRSKDAETNHSIVQKLGSIRLIYINDSKDCEKIKDDLQKTDAIVDALLGVGVKGEVREPIKTLVKTINTASAYKVSVDVPTPGLKPDFTLSFHNKKTEDAKVVSIGIPKEAETLCGPGDVYAAIPKRVGAEHKGDFGRLLVVGGSTEYVGTTMLVAKAACRTGVDLISIACPAYVAKRIAYDPNILIKPLASEDYLTEDDVDLVGAMNYDAMVLGNGLGLREETRSFVREIIKKANKPVIIDADALKLLSVKDIRASHVLTPHALEFRTLFGDYAEDFKDRARLVESKAKKTGSTVVLKGPVDIVSSPVYTKLNKTGNPGMTIGGTGDVLAGIIGALATKSELFESACAGAFLSGLAGDLCRDKLDYSFTATDVIEKIPDAKAFCRQYE